MDNKNNLEPILESILDNQDSHLENINKNIEHLLIQANDNNNDNVLEASLEVQGDIKDSIKELSNKLDPKEVSDGATLFVKGQKGEPFKYEDFTEEQLNKLKPIKGKDYDDGKDGYTPIKGVDYDDGKDGYTPIKGIDYDDGKDYILTENDKVEIAELVEVPIVEKIIEKTEIIKEVESKETGDTIKVKLEKLKGDKRLDIKAIKGIDEIKKEIKKYSDNNLLFVNSNAVKSINAGSNITITGDPLNPTISATGGGSGTGTVETIVAGTGISVDSTDPANPIVTNSAPDQVVSITAGTNIDSVTGTYPNFTINASTQGGSYTLPTASDTVLGGIKVGDRLSIDGNGVLSADVQGGGASTFTDLTDTPSNYTNSAGKGVRVNAGADGLEFFDITGDTDEKVKYDASDTTAGYVADKIIAGNGISVAEGTGSNENKLVITNTDKGSDVDLSGYALTGDIPADISELTDTTGIIPTSTSDLSNDSGFITAGDIPSIPVNLDFNLGGLGDVNDTGKATGKVLKYNSVSGDWEVGDDNNTTYTATDFDIKDLTDSTSLRSTWSGKQDALGFTPENVVNKRTSFQATPTDTAYPSEKLVKDSLDAKVEDSIVDGHTTIAPSGNAVFDALALKASLAGANTFTENQAITNTFSSGPGGLQLTTTQDTPNSGETNDSALYIGYTLSANSATNELVSRVFSFSFNNNLTGGGAIQNARLLNMASATQTGTTTTSLENIYIESGTANGTVTTGYGLHIVSLQGTTKYGISDNSGGKWLSTGVYATTVGSTNRDVYIDNTGLIGYVSSSLKYKNDVKDMENIDWLYELRPVNFTLKSDENNEKQYGLIAEEVDEINKHLVSYNEDGEPETVNYSRLITPLLKAVQDQQKEIDLLKEEIKKLKK